MQEKKAKSRMQKMQELPQSGEKASLDAAGLHARCNSHVGASASPFASSGAQV